MLAKRRHLDVDMTRPPAGLPERRRPVAHLGIGDLFKNLGARKVIGPPQVAPNSQNADDVNDLIVGWIPDGVRDHTERNRTDREVQQQLDFDERRPLDRTRQGN